jgi:hypothetical protein
MPKLFSETQEIENREGLALLRNLGENMNHLLGDRPVFLVSSCLDFAIEPVGDVLDIQGSHVSSIVPPLWKSLRAWSSQCSECERETGERFQGN